MSDDELVRIELSGDDVTTIITALQLWMTDESEPDRVRRAAQTALDNIGSQVHRGEQQ